MMTIPFTPTPLLAIIDQPALALETEQAHVVPFSWLEQNASTDELRPEAVIIAAANLREDTLTTVRRRYTWQPVVVFTDSDTADVWKNRYRVLVLPYGMWQQDILSPQMDIYIEMAEQQQVKTASDELLGIIQRIEEYVQPMEQLALILKRIIPYDALNIALLEDDTLRLIYHSGYGSDLANYWDNLRVPIVGANQQRVTGQGQIDLIPYVHDEPDWVIFEPTAWINSWLGIPIQRGSEVIGLINIDGRLPYQFTPKHMKLLNRLKTEIGAIFTTLDLWDAVESSTHVLSAIRRQNVLLSAKLDTETTLEGVCTAIADTVVNVFGQTDCGVMLVNEEQTELVRYARAGSFEVSASAPLYLNEKGLVVRSVHMKDMIYVPDVSIDPYYVANEPRTRSELVIPLKLRGEVIGVLDMQSSKSHAFSILDREALLVFADHAATAIENIRLQLKAANYTRELEKNVADRTHELESSRRRLTTILTAPAT